MIINVKSYIYFILVFLWMTIISFIASPSFLVIRAQKLYLRVLKCGIKKQLNTVSLLN